MTEKKKQIKREIRTTPGEIKLREVEPVEGEQQEESRTIEGVAIVFNKESEVLDEDWDSFREVIKPEAVTSAFLKTQDVRLNVLHDRSTTFARCNKGKGNLKLEVQKDGLHFSVEAPKDYIGDAVLNRVKDGVYGGCSFEFVPKDYTIEEKTDAQGNKYTLVTHTAFESISALTIAMDPAYEQTSVNARELAEKTPQALQRKQEAANARKREAEQAEARLRMRERHMEEEYAELY